MDELRPKIVFVTNRGGTHPNRKLYFDSIKADYQYVDFKVRWHGTPSSKWKMLLSGIVCAFSFPKKKEYKLIVTSDPQLPAILMKIFYLLKGDQKVVSYLGSQTLYFLYSGYYSKFTTLFYKFLLSRYDSHICNGNIQKELLQKILPIPDSKIFVNINGIGKDLYNELNQVKYNPESKNILFIGNLYSDWRIYYKGIDILLKSFAILKKTHKDLKLTLVGDYNESLIKLIEKLFSESFRKDIILIGNSSKLKKHFENALLYVHPARGDALPNSLLEALSSGIPAISSNLTGQCELIESYDPKLVCDINVESTVESIFYFINLSTDQKMKYSKHIKKACKNFTSDNAVSKFKSIIEKIEMN